MTRDSLLWVGIFTGPVVFLTSFLVNFVLAPLACVWRWKPALFAVSIVALVITAGAGLLAWRQWNQLGRVLPTDGDVPGDVNDALTRARVMAFGGVGLSVLCFIAIFSQGLVESLLGACE